MGNNANAAANLAYKIYNALGSAYTEGFISQIYDTPVWLGMDNRGVHEYSIDLDIYSERT